MQNNINNNQHDAFSESFRQKLENHQVPVDANSWDKIDARLKSKKRMIIPFWFWLSGSAAVAVIALLFTLRPLPESGDSIAKSTTTKIQQPFIQRRSITNYQQQKVNQSTKTTVKQVQLKTLKSDQVKSIVALDYPPAQVVLNDSIEKNKAYRNVHENNLKKEKFVNNAAQKITESKDSVTKIIRNIPKSLVDEQYIEPIVNNKDKNSWLLAASLGSNGSVPSANNKYESLIGDKNIVSAATNYTSIMTPNDFSKINYNAPVSFGLIIRKNMNKALGLESGLVYTYLLTTFENNVLQRNDARLHLHYIGVPLNLIVQLWNIPKWEIYLSGGGMIEKGIQSVYVQNQYGGNQTITTTAKTNIDGVQWSVNGAIGTTYKLQRNLGIFFEPKISYYFDNNQPLSARTEYPVVIGLTAGVRFQFK